MRPVSLDTNKYDFYVSEINREQYAQKFGQNQGAGIPVGEENIFSTQRINPAERSVEPAKTQRVNPYVDNQDLYATLNAMGTGEHSPSKYDEYTGNRLDLMI
ncbi:hypothetical protein IKQ26_00290 [bacterium]|nr:hypothetical protein [bacterium]